MAGDWLKFEKATPDKPEVFAIAARLDMDPDTVVGKLIRVWSWFDTHTTDGNGRSVTPSLLDRISGVSGFVSAMASVGWIVIDNEGVSLPNFDRHTGETSKGRALTAKRVAAHKEKGNAKGNAASVSPALPREEKRREEQIDQEQAKAKAGAPASGSRLPADWVLPADWLEWATTARPEIDAASEAAKFADHWRSQAGAKGRKADWQATWRNWIRNSYGPRAGPPAAGKPSAAADFRGKTYAATPIDQLPADLRDAARAALAEG